MVVHRKIYIIYISYNIIILHVICTLRSSSARMSNYIVLHENIYLKHIVSMYIIVIILGIMLAHSLM